MKNLSVKVSDEMYQEIKKHADSNNISVSEFMRGSVRRSLHQPDEEVGPAYDLLKKQLEESNEARERADTIILQLTKQVEQQTLMIEEKNEMLEDKVRIVEDKRNRPFWTRLKTVLGFSVT